MSNQLRPMPGQSVAYYGRVSTPKQKLEHQREMVQRWLDHEGIDVPSHMRFEDKEKRHKSAIRANFQRLLQLVEEGRVEWIVIATFDRWGIANIDEFFDFRKLLMKHKVRLWSVQNQLDLTGVADSDYYQIISLAIASTMQMGFYADRNIHKMSKMALDGWHATKEHAYGTDLMCFTLSERKPLFRVHMVSKDLERSGTRIYKVIHFDALGQPESEEVVTKMPQRDCKTSGYRLVPSIAKERIEIVKIIFELFDQGLTPREIGNHLHAMGKTYFGKFFGAHAIETIVRNPAYIGRPAWGKIATGAYRISMGTESRKPAERKKNDPIRFNKGWENYIFPNEPVFDQETFIPLSLWERVQVRINAKEPKGPRPRRKSKVIHPLNGLMICPDCKRRMVINHTTGRTGVRVNYFVCGAYCQSGKIACRANSVRFTKLDRAMQLCWENVQGQLKNLADIHNFTSSKAMTKEANVALKKMMLEFLDSFQEMGIGEDEPLDEKNLAKWRGHFMGQQEQRRAEVAEKMAAVDKRLTKLAELIEEAPSKTHRMKWHNEAEGLEKEKERLTASTASFADRLTALGKHAVTLYETLDHLKSTREGEIWSTFLDSVEPVFEEFRTKNRVMRTPTAFHFRPKSSVKDLIPDVLEIACDSTGKGSSP